jgi:hypothetical protein
MAGGHSETTRWFPVQQILDENDIQLKTGYDVYLTTFGDTGLDVVDEKRLAVAVHKNKRILCHASLVTFLERDGWTTHNVEAAPPTKKRWYPFGLF